MVVLRPRVAYVQERRRRIFRGRPLTIVQIAQYGRAVQPGTAIADLQVVIISVPSLVDRAPALRVPVAVIFRDGFGTVFVRSVLGYGDFRQLRAYAVARNVSGFNYASIFRFREHFNHGRVNFERARAERPRFKVAAAHQYSEDFVGGFAVVGAYLVGVLFVELFQAIRYDRDVSVNIFEIRVADCRLPFSVVLCRLAYLRCSQGAFRFHAQVGSDSPWAEVAIFR